MDVVTDLDEDGSPLSTTFRLETNPGDYPDRVPLQTSAGTLTVSLFDLNEPQDIQAPPEDLVDEFDMGLPPALGGDGARHSLGRSTTAGRAPASTSGPSRKNVWTRPPYPLWGTSTRWTRRGGDVWLRPGEHLSAGLPLWPLPDDRSGGVLGPALGADSLGDHLLSHFVPQGP